MFLTAALVGAFAAPASALPLRRPPEAPYLVGVRGGAALVPAATADLLGRLTIADLQTLRDRRVGPIARAYLAGRRQQDRARALRALTPAVRTAATRLRAASDEIRSAGGTIVRVNPLAGTLEVRLNARAAGFVRRLHQVTGIEPAPSRRDMGLSSAADAVGAFTWWNAGFTGGGGASDVNPTDLLIDSDKITQDHPAFAGVSFVTPPGAAPGCDIASLNCLHGTWVAGMALSKGVAACPTAAGYACNPADVDPNHQGTAPGVDKVLDDGDMGSYQNSAYSGITWALGIPQAGPSGTMPGASDPAEVLNGSYGATSAGDDVGAQSIDRLTATYGLMQVYATGNGGPGVSTIDCSAYDAICVGAYDAQNVGDASDDLLDGYSSRGPTTDGRKKPDIVAVGDASTTRADWKTTNSLWRFQQGTSLASPQVAGAAVLLEGSGITDPTAVKALLIDSASPGRAASTSAMGTQTGWQPDWGWGELNLTQAYAERSHLATASANEDVPRFYAATSQAAGDRATLVWNRRVTGTSPGAQAAHPLTNLNLLERDGATCATRSSSESTVDNVEQVRSPGAASVLYEVRADSAVDGMNSEPFAIASTRQITPLTSPQPELDVHVGDPAIKSGATTTVTVTAVNPSADLGGGQLNVALQPGSGLEVISGNGSGSAFAAGSQQTFQFVVRATGDGPRTFDVTASTSVCGDAIVGRAAGALTVDGTGPQASITVPAGTQPAGPIGVSWPATDPSGVAAYDVDASVDNGAFTAWLAGTEQTSGAYSGEAGHSYRFRARATDKLGNLGAWADSATVTIPALTPGPSLGPSAGPGPVPQPGKVSLSARLSLPILSRTLASMKVTGTTTSKATGKIKVTFQVRVRGKTTTIAKAVNVMAGRFTVTLKLPGKVRIWRTGTLKAAYAGSAAVTAGSTTRRVRRSGARVRSA
ncbi:MAG: hypothetical protein JWO74_1589 [Solirubrobacterales bacterium]|nr:hypothetical protein [Solirubrobacterales bacterium]